MTTNRAKTGRRLRNHDLMATDTLQKAVHHNERISGLHFKNQDFRGITLDGICLSDTIFEDCDLTGANISEASLENCTFKHSRLFDTCFCKTEFSNCQFVYSQFSATDLSLAQMSQCIFEGADTFNNDFAALSSFHDTVFLHDDIELMMTKVPLVVTGLSSRFVFLDTHVLIGSDAYETDHDSITLFNALLHAQLLQRNRMVH